MQLIFLLYISVIAVLHYSQALYIKPIESDRPRTADEWRSVQRKLGLTDQKLQVLKSQKDQKATMELLNRFINENPKYVTVPATGAMAQQKEQPNDFLATYHTIVQQLRNTQGTLKTSLNFELADKSPHKELKRSRRKIAVRMVSDMPSEKIDDLLDMFNQQYGLNRNDEVQVDEDDGIEDGDVEYNPFAPLPDPDYVYENLYEDGEDMEAAAARSSYGKFQDLILQAKRNEWQRELDETKLRGHSNEHFV